MKKGKRGREKEGPTFFLSAWRKGGGKKKGGGPKGEERKKKNFFHPSVLWVVE